MSLFGYWLVPRRDLDELSHRLVLVQDLLGATYGKVVQMALDLTALKAAVAANTQVDQSAVTLLTGLTAKIQELLDASGNTVDPAALQEIVDTITADNAALAAAVATNTPAGPADPPADPPVEG